MEPMVLKSKVTDPRQGPSALCPSGLRRVTFKRAKNLLNSLTIPFLTSKPLPPRICSVYFKRETEKRPFDDAKRRKCDADPPPNQASVLLGCHCRKILHIENDAQRLPFTTIGKHWMTQGGLERFGPRELLRFDTFFRA